MPHYLITQADFDKVKKFKTEKELLEYAKKQNSLIDLVVLSGDARRVDLSPTLRPMKDAARRAVAKRGEEKKPKRKKQEKAAAGEKPAKVTAGAASKVSPEQLLAALETAREPTAPREIANLLGVTTLDLRAPYAELRGRGQADSSGWGKGAKWRAVPKKAPPADLVGPEARS